MLGKTSVSARLTLLGCAVVLLTATLVGVGYVMVTRIAASLSDVRGLAGSKELTAGSDVIWELRFGIANYTLATPENRKKILDGRPKLYATLEERLKRYADLDPPKEQQDVLKELRAQYDRYKSGAPQWFELIDAGKLEEAADYRAKVTNAAGSAMVKHFNHLIENQAKFSQELTAESLAAADRARTLLLATGGVIILITAVSVFLLARSVTTPLNRMRETIVQVEKSNDFTLRVPLSSGDEIGQTAVSFNELMATLQRTLGHILDSAAKVSEAAHVLSASSDQVAAGSSAQSQATSAMAAAVEQLSVSITSVSDGARHALDLSRGSGQLSAEGAGIITKTAEGMSQIAGTVRDASRSIEELGQQSSRISSIVQVIKEVADQTNLLALNAAIEAARAGEQGRGFAVVADEVRKLAERTTNATEEITRMISEIQGSSQVAVATMGSTAEQVGNGVSLANQAGSAIVLIKDGAANVATVVGDISTALAEQRSASNDIAAQVEKIAQMTHGNSDAASAAAGAANGLRDLANGMKTVVARFRI